MALEEDKGKQIVDQLAKGSDIDEITFNLIFLHLFDDVIHQIDGMVTSLTLWDALNLVFLKYILFNYKMDSSKSMDENIDECTQIILMLESIDHSLDEGNEIMILLNSLLGDYQILKNALQYNSSLPKVDLVVARIYVRELELNALKSTRNGSNLYTKGKTKKKMGRKGNDIKIQV